MAMYTKTIRNRRCGESPYRMAVIVLAMVATICLSAVFCIDRADALDAGGLTGPGSITIHRYQTALSASAPASGTQSDAAQLPADATPLAGANYALYALDSLLVEGEGAPAAQEAPSAADVSVFLGTYAASGVSLSAPTATAATDAVGGITFGNLPFGYYLLVERAASATSGIAITVPMIITLPYANDEGAYVADVHVYPKSLAIAPIEKTNEGNAVTVGLGDTVPWKVSFPVPDGLKSTTSSGTAYGRGWSISDALDQRLDWTGSWTLEAHNESGSPASVALMPGTDVVCTYSATSHTVEWEFSDAATQAVADSDAASLSISFETHVNEKALIDVSPIYNDAAVDFVNATGDPFHHEVIDEAPDLDNPAHPRAYVGAIFIEKRLRGEDVLLAGAEFSLAASEADARSGRYLTRTVNGGDQAIAATTGADGTALMGSLQPGTYYLVETKAPSYTDATGKTVQCSLLTDPIQVTVHDSAEGAHQTVKVENHAATILETILPKTGDTTWPALILILVTIGAVSAVAIARWKTRPNSGGGRWFQCAIACLDAMQIERRIVT